MQKIILFLLFFSVVSIHTAALDDVSLWDLDDQPWISVLAPGGFPQIEVPNHSKGFPHPTQSHSPSHLSRTAVVAKSSDSSLLPSSSLRMRAHINPPPAPSPALPEVSSTIERILAHNQEAQDSEDSPFFSLISKESSLNVRCRFVTLLRKNSPNNSLQCPLCKSFTSANSNIIERHLLKDHFSHIQHDCPHCEDTKQFNLQIITTHLSTVHGKRNCTFLYDCTLCSQRHAFSTIFAHLFCDHTQEERAAIDVPFVFYGYTSIKPSKRKYEN